MPIDNQYLMDLPDIYRAILAAYPRFDSTRKVGYGLSYQSLYSALEGHYTPGQIMTACKNMADGKVMQIERGIFACPTPLGEELIAAITGNSIPEQEVPPFNPP